MTDSWASSDAARNSMKGNRSRDTKPELAVRRLLHSAGLRYRVDFRPLPRVRARADIVFTRQRVAVFIDGCFWHGCPAHYVASKTNADYWDEKISRNVARDLQIGRLLQDSGWTALRFWSHESPSVVAATIHDELRHNRTAL